MDDAKLEHTTMRYIDAVNHPNDALLSVAISIKRIADTLEAATEVGFDIRMNQLTDAIYMGIRNAR